MKFAQAFRFIFEDEQWLVRIAPLVLLTIASFIPLLGLVALVVILGYLFLLARDVRDGIQHPLPEWRNIQEKARYGGQLLLVIVLYNLPLLILGGCFWTANAATGGGLIINAISIISLCCTFPALLIYTVLAWSFLAVATSRYMDKDDFNVYFRIVNNWDVLTTNSALVRKWATYATIVNLLLIIGLLVPVIGWLFVAVFAIPVHGHLLGQFARRLNIQAKVLKHEA